MRTWSNERHVTAKHIDELRQFVYIGTAHEIAHTRLARIVFRGLQLIAVGIDAHRAEFVAVEFLSVESASLLAEENGAGAGEFDPDTEDHIDDGEDRDEQDCRDDNVETTFDHSVVEVFEWSRVDGDRGMPVERKHFYAVGNE